MTFLVYLCYLVFQLFSHKNLYADDSLDIQKTAAYPADVARLLHIHNDQDCPSLPVDVDDPYMEVSTAQEIETPAMCLKAAIALLIIVTVVCQWLIILTVSRSEPVK